MSDNQGKDGEMMMAVILSSISVAENGADFTRHSHTNSADLGADFQFRALPSTFEKIDHITKGTYELLPPSDANCDPMHNQNTVPEKYEFARIDVKSSEVISKAGVDKFVSDIPKHPSTKYHILAGGELKGKAKETFVEQQELWANSGIQLQHWSRQALVNLSQHYEPPKPSLPDKPAESSSSSEGTE